jgi:uncharacterized phiE125 gp8 family phage protein
VFGVTVVTPPTEEPLSLSLSEVKQHLRYPFEVEDELLKALIVSARVYCETVTGRAFVTQELRLTRDSFPGACEGYEFRLPRPPLASLTADDDFPNLGITYTDTSGATQSVSTASYVVDTSSLPGRVALAYGYDWPTDAIEQIAAVKVNYLAGYGAASAVPGTIKQAMLLLIGHWFVNREAVLTGTISKDIEFSLTALLSSEWSGAMAGTYG